MQKPFATQPELFVTPRPLSPAPAKCYNQDASIKASRTERDRRPQSLTGISPAACICCSIRRKFAKTRRPVSARCLAFASPVLVYFPCRSCAAESLCSPAIVRVPDRLCPDEFVLCNAGPAKWGQIAKGRRFLG